MSGRMDELKEGIMGDINEAKDKIQDVMSKDENAEASEETKQAIGNFVVTIVVTATLALSLIKGFKGKDVL